MRWIDNAVQRGRDVAMSSESLLSVKTIRETVAKQQKQVAKKQRESKQWLRPSFAPGGT